MKKNLLKNKTTFTSLSLLMFSLFYFAANPPLAIAKSEECQVSREFGYGACWFEVEAKAESEFWVDHVRLQDDTLQFILGVEVETKNINAKLSARPLIGPSAIDMHGQTMLSSLVNGPLLVEIGFPSHILPEERGVHIQAALETSLTQASKTPGSGLALDPQFARWIELLSPGIQDHFLSELTEMSFSWTKKGDDRIIPKIVNLILHLISG